MLELELQPGHYRLTAQGPGYGEIPGFDARAVGVPSLPAVVVGQIRGRHLAGGKVGAHLVVGELQAPLGIDDADAHRQYLEGQCQAAVRLPPLLLFAFAGRLGHMRRRRLEHGDQHAADAPLFATDGAVGNGEPHILQPPAAREGIEFVLVSDGFALPDALVDRPVDMPHLGPAFTGRLAESAGMLVGQDLGIAIVVELHQLLAPQHDHRETMRQHQVDGGAQVWRPPLIRSQRRG